MLWYSKTWLLLGLVVYVASDLEQWSVEEVHEFVTSISKSPYWEEVADKLQEHHFDGYVLSLANLEYFTNKLDIDEIFSQGLVNAVKKEETTKQELRKIHPTHRVRRRLQEDDQGEVGAAGQCLTSQVLDNSESIQTNTENISEIMNGGGGSCCKDVADIDERLKAVEARNAGTPLWNWNESGAKMDGSGLSETGYGTNMKFIRNSGEGHGGAHVLGTKAFTPNSGVYDWVLRFPCFGAAVESYCHWFTTGLATAIPDNHYNPSDASRRQYAKSADSYCDLNKKHQAKEVGEGDGDQKVVEGSCNFRLKQNDVCKMSYDSSTFRWTMDCGHNHAVVSVYPYETYYAWAELYDLGNVVELTCTGYRASGSEPYSCDHVSQIVQKWNWDPSNMTNDGGAVLENTTFGGNMKWKRTSGESHGGAHILGTVIMTPNSGVYDWTLHFPCYGEAVESYCHWFTTGIASGRPDNHYNPSDASRKQYAKSADSYCDLNSVHQAKTVGNGESDGKILEGSCDFRLTQNDYCRMTYDSNEFTFQMDCQQSNHAKISVANGLTYFPWAELYDTGNVVEIICTGWRSSSSEPYKCHRM